MRALALVARSFVRSVTLATKRPRLLSHRTMAASTDASAFFDPTDFAALRSEMQARAPFFAAAHPP